MNDTLNSTFSIDEEESYLSTFGTPLNFKKMSERPATVASEKNKYSSKPISFKTASHIRSKNEFIRKGNIESNLNDSFQSPFPLKKYNKQVSFLSPINYNSSQQSPMNFITSRNNAHMAFLSPQSIPKFNSHDIQGQNKSKQISETTMQYMLREISPLTDARGNIMMSSTKRMQLEEKNKKNLSNDEWSPGEKERLRNIVLTDARKLELHRMAMKNEDEWKEKGSSPKIFSPLSFISPVGKNKFATKSPISPLNFYSNTPKNRVISPTKLNKDIDPFFLREISPPRDKNGVIMMSSARKKFEEEKKRKDRMETSPEQEERIRKQIIEEVKQMEITKSALKKNDEIVKDVMDPTFLDVYDVKWSLNRKKEEESQKALVESNKALEDKKKQSEIKPVCPSLGEILLKYMAEKGIHKNVTLPKEKENVPVMNPDKELEFRARFLQLKAEKEEFEKTCVLENPIKESTKKVRSNISRPPTSASVTRPQGKPVLKPLTNKKPPFARSTDYSTPVRPLCAKESTSSVKRWR